MAKQLEEILRLKEVVQRTGLPKSTIYRFQSEGVFPRAVKLGVRSVGWPASRIEAWIEARIKAADDVRKEAA